MVAMTGVNDVNFWLYWLYYFGSIRGFQGIFESKIRGFRGFLILKLYNKHAQVASMTHHLKSREKVEKGKSAFSFVHFSPRLLTVNPDFTQSSRNKKDIYQASKTLCSTVETCEMRVNQKVDITNTI